MDELLKWAISIGQTFLTYLTSKDFLLQLAAITVCLLFALFLSRFLKKPLISERKFKYAWLKKPIEILAKHASAIPSVCFILLLFIAVNVLKANEVPVRIVQIVQGINIIILFYLVFFKYIQNGLFKFISLYIFFPVLLLYVVGYLDQTIVHLENTNFELGNISFSLLTLVRIVAFGIILFWLGRASNNIGKNIIKNRFTIDETAKELSLKAFQISLFIIVGIIFLQIAGIDLTALVVLGGAFGVGLGFGLQQIASNFISGIIILTDRSIKIGDYIEMEDGRSGYLTELSMRSATLETFEGKDVMVPNERFITTSFTNWTHQHQKQRYSLQVLVHYDTDLDFVFDLIRSICSDHPQVISSDHPDQSLRPDAEIEEFANSGIKLLIEFWMEGIDDGPNKVSAEIKYAIWKAFKEHKVVIPYPQHEVTILK